MSSHPVHRPQVRRAPPASAASAAPPPLADMRSIRELKGPSRALILDQQLQVQAGDTFLDLGCGRGLVLLDALSRGCSAAVGVEFNANCQGMLEDVLRQSQWSVLSQTEIAGGGKAYRL